MILEVWSNVNSAVVCLSLNVNDLVVHEIPPSQLHYQDGSTMLENYPSAPVQDWFFQRNHNKTGAVVHERTTRMRDNAFNFKIGLLE
jgi:hypothetical protein